MTRLDDLVLKFVAGGAERWATIAARCFSRACLEPIGSLRQQFWLELFEGSCAAAVHLDQTFDELVKFQKDVDRVKRQAIEEAFTLGPPA